MNRPRVLFVGPFPPPLHGQAFVNASLADFFARQGFAVTRHDLSAPSLSRSLRTRLGRTLKVLRLFPAFARELKRHEVLYMSVSAGLGQVHEIVFARKARAAGKRAFLHHHNYAYLGNRPRRLTQALVRAAGPEAVHVVLSDAMGAKLKALYPQVRTTFTLLNSAFVDPGPEPEPRRRLRCAAFLGNLSREKGVLVFLRVAEACRAAGLGCDFRIAGAPMEAAAIRAVRAAAARSLVEYVGPVYGESKRTFLEAADVLLSPNRGEAVGLVNLEASARGVPVVAYDCGSVAEVLGPDGWVPVRDNQDFVEVALGVLRHWSENPAALARASEAARRQFRHRRAEGLGQEQAVARVIADSSLRK